MDDDRLRDGDHPREGGCPRNGACPKYGKGMVKAAVWTPICNLRNFIWSSYLKFGTGRQTDRQTDRQTVPYIYEDAMQLKMTIKLGKIT